MLQAVRSTIYLQSRLSTHEAVRVARQELIGKVDLGYYSVPSECSYFGVQAYFWVSSRIITEYQGRSAESRIASPNISRRNIYSQSTSHINNANTEYALAIIIVSPA